MKPNQSAIDAQVLVADAMAMLCRVLGGPSRELQVSFRSYLHCTSSKVNKLNDEHLTISGVVRLLVWPATLMLSSGLG